MGVQPAALKSRFSQTRAFPQSIQMARRFRHPDAPNCLPTKTSNQESQILNRHKVKFKILNSKLPNGSIQNSQFLIPNCRRAQFKILNS